MARPWVPQYLKDRRWVQHLEWVVSVGLVRFQGDLCLCPPVQKSPSNSSGPTGRSPVPEGPSGTGGWAHQHPRNWGWSLRTEKVAVVGFRRSSGGQLPLFTGPKVPLKLLRSHEAVASLGRAVWGVRWTHPTPQGPRVDPTKIKGDFLGVSSFFRGPLVSVRRPERSPPTPPTPRDDLLSRKGHL